MSLGTSWDLEIDPSIYRVLRRFPRKDARRIFETIGALPLNPYAGDIQKMNGEVNTWRRRVESYRIFYEVLLHERKILVSRVERRTSSTY